MDGEFRRKLDPATGTIRRIDEGKPPGKIKETRPSGHAEISQHGQMGEDLNTQESVGARLLRELSPEQLAAVIDDSSLGRLLTRYEKQLREIELPEGGFTTKAQADAAGALATTFRDLQNLQVGLGLPVMEMPDRVREAIRMRSAYVKHHTKAGEVIAARPRGRPPRLADKAISSSPYK